MIVSFEILKTPMLRAHTVLVEKDNIATGKVDSVSSTEAGNCESTVSLNAMCFDSGLMCTYGRRRRRLHEEPYWGYLKTNVTEGSKSVVWVEQ